MTIDFNDIEGSANREVRDRIALRFMDKGMDINQAMHEADLCIVNGFALDDADLFAGVF